MARRSATQNVDMPDVEPSDEQDPEGMVVRQLRKLREGAGATRERLLTAGALLSALGTSDPEVARRQLGSLIEQLDQREHASALAVDLGIDLERHLGRRPTDREWTRLGERRAAYSDLISRDVKTLARWSDSAAAELRLRIFNDTFTGHLWVIGAVRGERIIGITMAMQELGAGDAEAIDDDWSPKLTRRQSVDYENPSDGPSLPCLLYGLPRDWRPATLTLAVRFLDGSAPSETWGIHSPTFFEMSYAHRRHRLEMADNRAICRFVSPRHDRVYGVWWRAA